MNTLDRLPRRTLALICALAAGLSISTPAPAADAKADAAAPAADVQPAKPGSPAARAIAAKGSDFDRMPVVLGLEGDALDKFKQALAARDAAYKKWADSDQGKAYDAARKEVAQAEGAGGNAAPAAGQRRPGRRGAGAGGAGGAATPQAAPQANPQAAPANPKLAEAKKKYEPLRAEQEKLRKDLRAEFNKQFSTIQLRAWTGHMLYDRAIDRFAAAKLSDEQRQQAQVVCWTMTAEIDVAAAADKDPYLAADAKLVDRAAETIRSYVLRADQRAVLRSAPARVAEGAGQ